MSNFIQLPKESCKYLLELIADIDQDTDYTARQRAYTIPKLQQIMNAPETRRLAIPDVDYLLELIEDDELESTEQIREMTRSDLENIQTLQRQKQEEMRSIEQQRTARRARRNPVASLQEHFEHTA